MNTKKEARLRRSLRSRMKIKRLDIVRLSVYKSAKHIYAQLISKDGSRILCSVSTQSSDFKERNTGNISAAEMVGKLIGEKAKSLDIDRIAFDRSGYKYHGRVKALAEGARSAGLVF